ncbi:MAG TPA: Gfo/Idh/MocA family oxidoreductase [Bryobacteraceae bacterium]|nr:Gfo/Idh/MocA family oxidoreductase [Bryobacteraceae bacterium]
MPKISRRQAMLGAAAPMLMKSKTAFGSQANSAVSFGIIGTGGRGQYVGTFMAKNPNARLAAICDKYPDRIDAAKTHIPGADQVPAFKDYQQLLAMKEIDAVLIATPVYLHPEHFEAAVKAGKHIYCEKPGGADVAGCKRLLKAGERADKTKTIQFGYQQRFSPEYLKGMSQLQSGRIGDMKLMMSYWVLGGMAPTGFTNPYSGPDEKIRNWGRWVAYSGGPIVEQDCHGVDTLNWYAGDAHPVRAVGTGGLRYPIFYGDWPTDHHNISYFYPNNVEGWLISIKHTAGYRDVKEQLYGSKGLIEVSRSYYKLHGPEGNWQYPNADDLRDRSLIEKQDSKREITIDATEAFFRSIVEKKPYHMWKSSGESTLTAILGRMAIEKKREVTWDEMMRSA